MDNFSLIDLFKMMHTKGASDLHLKSDAVPAFRIKGEIVRPRLSKISSEQLRKMVYAVLTEREIQILEQEKNLDTAIGIPRVGRFRINIFIQRGTVALASRQISFLVPDLKDLNLPTNLNKATDYLSGLVLVTGASGSGRSNTLAALINHINKTRKCHILCIEDPIEFVYQDDQAIINQRELGVDVKSFRDALKHAMKEDPDVILIGEIRDADTVKFALSAAETGYLVFGTLHSNNVIQTITRILSFFPNEQHHELRQDLSVHLKAVISQMLLPSCKKDIMKVPACEIMFQNPTISRMIAEGQEKKIIQAITGAIVGEGMQDFERTLVDLVNNKFIDRETALAHAENPESLEMKLKGIFIKEGGGIMR